MESLKGNRTFVLCLVALIGAWLGMFFGMFPYAYFEQLIMIAFMSYGAKKLIGATVSDVKSTEAPKIEFLGVGKTFILGFFSLVATWLGVYFHMFPNEVYVQTAQWVLVGYTAKSAGGNLSGIIKK